MNPHVNVGTFETDLARKRVKISECVLHYTAYIEIETKTYLKEF